MKKKWSVLILFVVLNNLSAIIYTQEIKRVSGSGQEELTKYQSQIEVENKAKEKAEIDALEKAFGRVIIQGNSTYITNLQTGEEVQTNTVFRIIANTYVKGEVLEVLSEEYSRISGTKTIDGKTESFIEIRCDIVIKAKEIITPPVNFVSFPLACLDEKCSTTSFKNKDPFYLFFMSPVSGYITVYLDDGEFSQCLYPHYNMSTGFDGGVPIEADKKYFLFSDKPEYSYFPDVNIIPVTYELYTNNIQEMNRLFIIFSKIPLNKPFLKDVSEELLKKEEFNQGYRLPKSLKSEDFQRWLISYRSRGKDDVQVKFIDITITK